MLKWNDRQTHIPFSSFGSKFWTGNGSILKRIKPLLSMDWMTDLHSKNASTLIYKKFSGCRFSSDHPVVDIMVVGAPTQHRIVHMPLETDTNKKMVAVHPMVLRVQEGMNKTYAKNLSNSPTGYIFNILCQSYSLWFPIIAPIPNFPINVCPSSWYMANFV